MSHELTNAILGSQKAIVPFENIGGRRQVSSIVTCTAGTYVSFSLIDSNEKYLGPIDIKKVDVPSESIAAWLGGQEDQYELVQPLKIDVIKSSFLLDGVIETVIEGVDIWSQDGQFVRLRREGASYPYGLVMAVPTDV